MTFAFIRYSINPSLAHLSLPSSPIPPPPPPLSYTPIHTHIQQWLSVSSASSRSCSSSSTPSPSSTKTASSQKVLLHTLFLYRFFLRRLLFLPMQPLNNHTNTLNRFVPSTTHFSRSCLCFSVTTLVGWGRQVADPYGQESIKARLVNLISAVRTLMRSKSSPPLLLLLFPKRIKLSSGEKKPYMPSRKHL